MQPWCTPFSFLNQSVVPCLVLTVASWLPYRFLRRQVKWSGIPISLRIFQFVMIHTVKGFGVVNKAEMNVFLKLSCFFDDATDVGNFISGSSAFSKSSLNVWTFMVHIFLKPGLKNFTQFIVIHTVKGFSIINKAEIDVFFWNSLAFSMTQWMLPICTLVPLPFLNPTWTSGCSQFTYCWSLAWRVLSITLLVCEMSAIVW